MHSYEKLLALNKKWANEKTTFDPQFFKDLQDVQTPPNEITQTQPGEIFIHRNIANLVVNTDVNVLSVLEYAVHHLKVKHIIVCGHYGCGGIKAATTNHNLKQVLNMWLRNIKDIYRIHRDELDGIENEDNRVDRLVELNVQEQVMNLAKTSIIQRAWKEGNGPDLHGWVYGLKDGVINPVFEMKAGTHIDPLYEFDDL